jgi:hypothetical protein
MKIKYKPNNINELPKPTVARYERAIENAEIYINNLVNSYSYLLDKANVNKNELLLEHGLINERDLIHGENIDIASFVKWYLGEYLDESTKRAYLMGFSSGDNEGAKEGLGYGIRVEKEKSLKGSSKGGKQRNKETVEREKYFYQLIQKELERSGKEILKVSATYFMNKGKPFPVEERSVLNSIRKARNKIRAENGM